MLIFGNSIELASRSLDFLWKKESAINDNLSNVETPGYKAKIVTFEEEFGSRLREAAQGGTRQSFRDAILGAKARVETSKEESVRADGNNVNADTQLIEMTRTALQYQYLLSSVNSDITMLNTVIKGQ